MELFIILRGGIVSCPNTALSNRSRGPFLVCRSVIIIPRLSRENNRSLPAMQRQRHHPSTKIEERFSTLTFNIRAHVYASATREFQLVTRERLRECSTQHPLQHRVPLDYLRRRPCPLIPRLIEYFSKKNIEARAFVLQSPCKVTPQALVFFPRLMY